MLTTRIKTYEDVKKLMDKALTISMYVTQCDVNHTIKNSPGKFIFTRDMFINAPVIADLIAIRQILQLFIDNNLMQHNGTIYNYK